MPELVRTETWAPIPQAATLNRVDGRRYCSAANGTATCCGGWQFVYRGLTPGHSYRVTWDAATHGIDTPGDALVGHAFWSDLAPDAHRTNTQCNWDYVCGESVAVDQVRFDAVVAAPADSDGMLTVRATLRWVETGAMEVSQPQVTDLGPVQPSPPVRVAVVTGREDFAQAMCATVAKRVEYYAGMCERVCAERGVQLIALPEICLQWHVPGSPVDNAVDVPGPETGRFAEIARHFECVIVVGLQERAGSAVHNSAVIIATDGSIAGTYRKAHLASFEAVSGILPGRDFPVAETTVGRIGCNICMDSSAAESSRMVGLNGADFLVLPIMGDHRASRWSRGNPQLDEDRWRCIMRTRAMDNQLTMVVARNNSRGSCIVDRSGTLLAYSDGTSDSIVADVARDDGFRKWNGGCFRQVNWRQRRPHLYDAFVDPGPVALQRLRATGPKPDDGKMG